MAIGRIVVRFEPGWLGAFTRNEVARALRNGTRVVKTNSESGDANKDGAPGVVLGSISHPDVQNGAVMYFIEWDAMPRVAVGAMAQKVEVMQ